VRHNLLWGKGFLARGLGCWFLLEGFSRDTFHGSRLGSRLFDVGFYLSGHPRSRRRNRLGRGFFGDDRLGPLVLRLFCGRFQRLRFRSFRLLRFCSLGLLGFRFDGRFHRLRLARLGRLRLCFCGRLGRLWFGGLRRLRFGFRDRRLDAGGLGRPGDAGRASNLVGSKDPDQPFAHTAALEDLADSLCELAGRGDLAPLLVDEPRDVVCCMPKVVRHGALTVALASGPNARPAPCRSETSAARGYFLRMRSALRLDTSNEP
jgi:hypothetical protein